MVTSVNLGIAWNKNRALFMLSQILGCETVILLGDDVRPTAPGWTLPWADAAARWAHINWVAPRITEMKRSPTEIDAALTMGRPACTGPLVPRIRVRPPARLNNSVALIGVLVGSASPGRSLSTVRPNRMKSTIPGPIQPLALTRDSNPVDVPPRVIAR